MTRVNWAIAAGAMLAGCGPDPGPVGWIDARAAVVQCTSAGRDRIPPVLVGLPVPVPPSGLFARRLDPMALDDLGYQRDTVACALLLPPDTDSTNSGKALAEARRAAGKAAAALAGRCACEAATRLDARELLPQCVDASTRRQCEVDAPLLEAMQEILAPVEAALAETRAPLMHWRLVGKTDRAGWFARQQEVLLERHEGGSTVFVRGQAVPGRGNGPLVEALFEEEGVVAIVRQSSGQALLVVRELGKTLVLDHFEYPAAGDTLTPLLPFLDNASVGRYRALLAKPSDTRKLRLEPGKGNLVEVDVSHLEAVDAAIRGGADFYDGSPAPERQLPERRVELVAAQAPFGKQGQELDVRIELTESGAAWASLLTSADLMPGLDGLSLEAVEIEPPGDDMPYALAGSTFETSVVYGLEQVPAVMSAVEERYPGSIDGTARAWSFTMPVSNLDGLVTAAAGFTGLRTAFSERVYTIDVTIAEEDRVLQVTVQPD